MIKNFSANLKVEYKTFYDHSISSTKIYNQKAEFNKCINEKNNIVINEEFEHKIDFLTKEDIEYLENENMCLKIYATEQIEKKGRVSMEEVLKNIKEEEELHQPTPKKNGNININNNNKINDNKNLIKDWNVVDKNELDKNAQNNNPNQNKIDANGNPNKKKKKGCVIF